MIEGNAGKPIYQMSKWWARRRSSVFRSILIAAATKAPDDPSRAAKLVWDNYYANHQKKGGFNQLKVADIFMGGGTTLVEGSRLGMQMLGNDLNPVAWFVVKQELENVDLDEVRRLLADIEAEVKPQIMPYYYCDGPNGEKGRWTHLPSGRDLVLSCADKIIYVASKDSSPELNDIERFIADNKTENRQEKVMVILNQHSNDKSASLWTSKRNIDKIINIHINNYPDYGRFIRLITGRSTGLVLSGGGARGFAHIGLFKALDDLKIDIDYIGGSSVGAGLGALYAMGKDYQTIFDEFYGGFVKFNSLKHLTFPIMSIYSGKTFHEVLLNSYKEIRIEDLRYNFFCVTTNLSTKKTEIREKGSLLNAIRESASLPGILPPVIKESGIYVDGGISNNLPVDIMREKIKRGKIIAVYLTSGASYNNNSNTNYCQSGYEILLKRLFQKKDSNYPNIGDVIMSSMMLSSSHHDECMKKMLI